MARDDLSALLPEDVLAGVLRLLAPLGLATSRCVCKAWRGVVDAHSLLRPELLPRSLAGVLVNFHRSTACPPRSTSPAPRRAPPSSSSATRTPASPATPGIVRRRPPSSGTIATASS